MKIVAYCKPLNHSGYFMYHEVYRTEVLHYADTEYFCVLYGSQNSIQKEFKSRLKLGNACYHSVQNLLSSSLLSKNLKIKIYRTIILPVVLYGCETW